MKKILAMLLAAMATLSVVACAAPEVEDEPEVEPVVSETVVEEEEEEAEGKVFNIWVWNEEFKGFFEKYYKVPDGIEVKFTINTNTDGVYQQKLDEALLVQADLPADEKIDMFLAEADYIGKYVDSEYTMGIEEIGYENADTMYEYTIKAATDANGVCKGVSFQCCPSALIYRRSIAKDVLGTDDPAEVQEAFADWDKFMETAKAADAKGYDITSNYAATYRVFSNNCTIPWVDADNNLQFDEGIVEWIKQTKVLMDGGMTQNLSLWDGSEQGVDGKCFCFFGPAWYFNFSMTTAVAETSGDWAICKGPQAHFWGGTWLLASASTDNPTMLKDVFEAFTIDEQIVTNLVVNEAQYPNNTAIVEKFANDESYASEFLGGQNDIALFSTMAGDIKWENHTNYDQILNEKLQEAILPYLTGEKEFEDAMNDYYGIIEEKYPDIVIGEDLISVE